VREPAPAAGRALAGDGIIAVVTGRFATLIGLWPDDPGGKQHLHMAPRGLEDGLFCARQPGSRQSGSCLIRWTVAGGLPRSWTRSTSRDPPELQPLLLGRGDRALPEELQRCDVRDGERSGQRGRFLKRDDNADEDGRRD
jgi:hypothetical protein